VVREAGVEICGKIGDRTVAEVRQRLHLGNTFLKKEDPQRSCLA